MLFSMAQAQIIWGAKISNVYLGSVALLSHFDKVLALSKFALLKYENEVNPKAWISLGH